MMSKFSEWMWGEAIAYMNYETRWGGRNYKIRQAGIAMGVTCANAARAIREFSKAYGKAFQDVLEKETQ